MRAFNFGGVSSRDYGVGISGTGTYDAPERDVEVVEIPGRNGEIVIDKGRFKNITVTFPAWMSRDFDEWFPKFKAAMCQFVGYQRLEDEYDTEHFREALYASPMNPATGIYNKSGHFDVVFNCKPQRFLKSGEMELTFYPVEGTANGSKVSGIEVTPGKRLKVKAQYENESGSATIQYYNSGATLIQTDTSSVTDNVLSYNGIVPAGAVTASVEYPVAAVPYVRIIHNGIETDYTDTGLVLQNPTLYTARPIISIYGGEDQTFYALTVSPDMMTTYRTLEIVVADYTTDYNVDHVTINSALQDCYYDGLVGALPMVVNMNPYVVIKEGQSVAYDFPVIDGGKALTIPTVNVSKITVKPGWWEV